MTPPHAELQRLRDLVRQQRSELHDANLISDEEYAALAMDGGAVPRLMGYDEMRTQLAAQAERVELEAYQAGFKAATESLMNGFRKTESQLAAAQSELERLTNSNKVLSEECDLFIIEREKMRAALVQADEAMLNAQGLITAWHDIETPGAARNCEKQLKTTRAALAPFLP